MHLPEFILLAIATMAAIAAGLGAGMLALGRPNLGVVRVLFWIAAIAFGSLGIVWSSTSTQPLGVQMLVSGIIGALAAAGLTWGLWEVRAQESANQPTQENKSEANPSETARPSRGPTLEATRGSKIDATGAVIPGDLPFQFGKADQNSIIDMPGLTVTKNENGSYTVSPGEHVNRAFPPPTGEFSSLSNTALSEKVQIVVSELKQFQSDFRRDVFPPYTKVGPIDEEYTRRSTENWHKYQTTYEEKFSKLALSLASEMLVRIGSIEGSSMSPEARNGANLVYWGRFVGHNPAEAAAEFLKALASNLPK